MDIKSKKIVKSISMLQQYSTISILVDDGRDHLKLGVIKLYLIQHYMKHTFYDVLLFRSFRTDPFINVIGGVSVYKSNL